MLKELNPSEVFTEFVFKDRLFASLSNFAYTVTRCMEGGGQDSHGRSDWQDIEAQARMQLQKVDQVVESGSNESYERFESETIEQVGKRLHTVLEKGCEQARVIR